MSSRRSRRERKARLGQTAGDGLGVRPPQWENRVRGIGTFVRDYTAGINTRDLKRLFDRDAVSAYSVLTRDHSQVPEPKGRLKRWLFRAKLGFLGLSYKLTPPRRMLFAFSLVCVALALLQGSYVYEPMRRGQAMHISIDFSPFWFMLSSGALVLLLALELVDRIRVRDELEVARELQSELLPHGAIELQGYRVAHSYRTANEVGGDYYEVLPLPDGRVALMVGDATGHGMAAGLVMAIANATLKTALDLDPDPRQVLKILNRTLYRTGTRRTFMTVFYALLTPATGELVTISAGHPFPLLRRASGRMEELGSGGLPLGVRADLAPEPQTTVLEPGDLLLLYTDGLAEAIDPSAEAFGYQRIAGLTRLGGGPQAVHDRILASFDTHVGDELLRDDLTLLVISRDEQGPTQQAASLAAAAASPAPTAAATPLVATFDGAEVKVEANSTMPPTATIPPAAPETIPAAASMPPATTAAASTAVAPAATPSQGTAKDPAKTAAMAAQIAARLRGKPSGPSEPGT